MTSITTRAGKGSPLTHNEVDANFTNLNNDKLDTAGIALGSAASPTLKFTGDLNTGIYSPGADQLAVATNGAGRLFVDATGNVAIIQSPASTPSYTKSFNVSAQNASIALRANSLGTYSDQGIFFAVDGVNYSQIYNDGVGQLIFRTGSGLSERLRITSAGLVGIGVSAPQEIIHANGNIRLTNGAGFTAANSVVAKIGAFAGSANQFDLAQINFLTQSFSNNGQILFSTASSSTGALTEAIRIDSSQRVGIGTTSPSSLLHLADAGNITVGSSTGTKIGTATTQKIGFFDKAPVVQPTAVADATDAATVITQLNALLTRMRNLGLIAT